MPSYAWPTLTCRQPAASPPSVKTTTPPHPEAELALAPVGPSQECVVLLFSPDFVSTKYLARFCLWVTGPSDAVEWTLERLNKMDTGRKRDKTKWIPKDKMDTMRRKETETRRLNSLESCSPSLRLPANHGPPLLSMVWWTGAKGPIAVGGQGVELNVVVHVA